MAKYEVFVGTIKSIVDYSKNEMQPKPVGTIEGRDSAALREKARREFGIKPNQTIRLVKKIER